MIHWLSSALGLMLLFMGRRLFWLFVGGAGFVAGLQVAPLLLGPQRFLMVWVAGLICGIIGALLALFFQRLAIILGGFLAGVSLGLHLLPAIGSDAALLISLACGIAGAAALFFFFDWVLIFLSAMIGAALIIDSLGGHLPWATNAYLVLVILGVAVQARWWQARPKTVR
jgi:hypothetical protein